MTFEEFKARYDKERQQEIDRYEEWLEEQAELKKRKESVKNGTASASVLTPVDARYDDAEFLLEQLLLSTTILTVAMHHLSYYASLKGNARKLDKNDQLIMQRTSDEIEAFLNLMEGEGITTGFSEQLPSSTGATV